MLAAFLLILVGILVMVFGVVLTVLFLFGPVSPMGGSVHDPKPADAIVTGAIALGGVGLIVWGALL